MPNEPLSDSPKQSASWVGVPTRSGDSALSKPDSDLILRNLINGFHATSILVLKPGGEIIFANSIAANGFPDHTGETLIGMNLVDIAPAVWAQERIEYMNRAIELRRPIVVIEILAGTRLSATITPINIPDESTNKPTDQWMLMITIEQVTPRKLNWLRRTIAPDDIIDAKIIDLGRLAVLSPRELEVVALMGQGLRQKQIAERLHRSVSTIDRHCERIGEKLGITDRVELVGLAREAALEVSDASRTNINFSRKSPKPG